MANNEFLRFFFFSIDIDWELNPVQESGFDDSRIYPSIKGHAIPSHTSTPPRLLQHTTKLINLTRFT